MCNPAPGCSVSPQFLVARRHSNLASPAAEKTCSCRENWQTHFAPFAISGEKFTLTLPVRLGLVFAIGCEMWHPLGSREVDGQCSGRSVVLPQIGCTRNLKYRRQLSELNSFINSWLNGSCVELVSANAVGCSWIFMQVIFQGDLNLPHLKLQLKLISLAI